MQKKLFTIFISFMILLPFLSCSSAQDEIVKAITWLRERTVAKDWQLNVEQHSFSLLALKNSLTVSETEEAITRLFAKSQEEKCWPKENCNAKETAIAKLALNSFGKSTEKADEYLLSKIKSYEVKWLIQIITEERKETSCLINYSGSFYQLTIKGNETMGNEGNENELGPCFNVGRYWLELKEDCNNKSFTIVCNSNFAVSFMLKKDDKEYVTTKFERAEAENENFVLTIKAPKAYCIAENNECDYEATLWTVYAFHKEGKSIEEFIPYLVLERNNNQMFLPEPFLYALTNSAVWLKETENKQAVDGLWETEAYNAYYATALVGFITNANVDGWEQARNTLLIEQKKAGYWRAKENADIIRDTAAVLLALQQSVYSNICYYDCVDEGKCSEIGGTLHQELECGVGKECCEIHYENECESKGGSCTSGSCPSGTLKVNYTCENDLKCCMALNLIYCQEIGSKCASNEKCTVNGFITNFITVADGDCCLGTCVLPTKHCEELNGVICKPEENKSCAHGRWLPSIEEFCCEASSCVNQLLNCDAMNGHLCEEQEVCYNGHLVVSKDSNGEARCCIQGQCIKQRCEGEICEEDELCVDGTLVRTADAERCCLNGRCLKKCSSLNGTLCPTHMECKGNLVEASDTKLCCIGSCVEKKGKTKFLFIFIILLLLALLLILILIKKKKKPKVKKAEEKAFLSMPSPSVSRPIRRTISLSKVREKAGEKEKKERRSEKKKEDILKELERITKS
ncbi:hypothetical protein B6U82_00660 [Candidatus Pacearchaeota archaeon ex4484_31]|nr:MAG: hypothetical protein B6U82_00660 [Candidatus Pacearchaeota archaeon ex4484_31]